MIKLILMAVWWPDKFHAAEINIEGLEVKAIKRIGHNIPAFLAAHGKTA